MKKTKTKEQFRQELNDIFRRHTKGLSEDVDGGFYTIYDKEAIIKEVILLNNF